MTDAAVDELLVAFTDAVGNDRDAHALDASSLAHELDAAYRTGRRAWPTAQLSRAEFGARLGLAVALVDAPPSDVDVLRPDEQFLVAACVAGCRRAVSALEDHTFDAVRSVASRFVGFVTASELEQLVRSKLLAARPPEEPGLARFSGITPLRAWIRVIALRSALDVQRSSRRRSDRHAKLPRALPGHDPEFFWMRQLYTDQFERILTAELQALKPRQRNLLRARVAHGLGLDEIARLYGVHRATVARWLRDARNTLIVGVRQGLCVQAGLSPSEAQSVLTMIRSGVSDGVIARGLQVSHEG